MTPATRSPSDAGAGGGRASTTPGTGERSLALTKLDLPVSAADHRRVLAVLRYLGLEPGR